MIRLKGKDRGLVVVSNRLPFSRVKDEEGDGFSWQGHACLGIVHKATITGSRTEIQSVDAAITDMVQSQRQISFNCIRCKSASAVVAVMMHNKVSFSPSGGFSALANTTAGFLSSFTGFNGCLRLFAPDFRQN